MEQSVLLALFHDILINATLEIGWDGFVAHGVLGIAGLLSVLVYAYRMAGSVRAFFLGVHRDRKADSRPPKAAE